MVLCACMFVGDLEGDETCMECDYFICLCMCFICGLCDYWFVCVDEFCVIIFCVVYIYICYVCDCVCL